MPSLLTKSQVVQVIVVVGVALLVRLVVLDLSPVREGMTWGYQNAAYMFAAGYGFKRTVGDYGVRGLEEFSRQLAEKGEQITPQNRPDLMEENLRPIHHRLPGYPAFMFVIYKLVGEPLKYWTGVIQAIITAFYPLLIYVIAVRLFDDKRSAWIAAWISVFYVPLVFSSVSVLPMALVIGFVLLATYFCIRGVQDQNYMFMLIAGLMIGMGCYFKPSIMHLWLFLGLALFFVQKGWKRPAISTVLIMFGTYLILVPWAYRNHTYTGEYLWGSTMTWNSIWKAVGEHPNPWGVVRLDEHAHNFAQQNGFEDEMTPEANRWFKELVISYIKEDPVFFISASLKRLPLALAAPFSPGFPNPQRDKGMFSHFLNKEGKSYIQVFLSNGGYVLRAFWERIIISLVSLMGTLSLFFLVLLNYEKRKEAILLLSVPAYFICVHVPFITATRYLAPMIPFQIIAMVFFIKWLKDHFANRQHEPVSCQSLH